MKVIVEAGELAKRLEDVVFLLGTRMQIYPILSNVVLEAEGDVLTIFGTDFEVACLFRMPCEVKEEGSVCVPYLKLCELCKRIKEGEMEFLVDHEFNLRVKHESLNLLLRGLPRDEYPKLPPFEAERKIVISNDVFVEGIKKTIFAVANQDPRKALEGLLIKCSGDLVEFVGMDGSRLARLSRGVVSNDYEGEVVFLVRKYIVQKFLKLAKKYYSDVVMSKDDTAIFDFGDCKVSVVEISAEYPSYELSERCDCKVSLNKNDFKRALEQVSVVAHKDFQNVKMEFSEGRVQFYADNPDVGEASMSIPVVGTEGVVDIAREFRAKYILDFLRVVKGETVSVGFNKALGINIFFDDMDKDYECIIMHLLEA